MSYKGVIVKIQNLKAFYDYEIEQFKKDPRIVHLHCQREEYIRILENFSNELDLLLASEKYGMKNHFKY